jgi:hypothetical protein
MGIHAFRNLFYFEVVSDSTKKLYMPFIQTHDL